MASEEHKTLIVRFQGVSVAEAGRKAAALRDDLLNASPSIHAEIRKEDQTTQDFGATLVLLLGAPAVVAVAKGIADYLRRKPGKLSIEADGRVIFEGESADAARIVEAMGGKKMEGKRD
jgi:hypothetical protein